MGEPSKEAIEKRAKALCAEEGRRWEPKMLTHPGERFLPLESAMDEKGRNQFRTKARPQLIEEAGAQR
jgi:hypothetical protein